MRSSLDPSRHYKANDSKEAPRYFQVGTPRSHAPSLRLSLSFVSPPLPGGAGGGWACRFLLWKNPQETAETDNGGGAAC